MTPSGDEHGRETGGGRRQPASGRGAFGRGTPRLSSLEGGREADAPGTGAKRIALPVRASSCAVARQFVRTSLLRDRWAGDVEAAVLLSSELVANALGHAHSPCFLALRIEGTRLRVEASDADPDPPVVGQPGPDSAHGRGLLLLDALASAWGSRIEAATGKTIWFELSVHAGRRSRTARAGPDGPQVGEHRGA